MDQELLSQWTSDSKTLSELVDTFSLADKADLNEEVKRAIFEEKKQVFNKANFFTAPKKKKL